MTHFTDSMPIRSIGGIWSVDLWNPKYTAHIFKVVVAIDMLSNIVWICPLALGTSADVLICDGYGHSRTQDDFFDFEVGGHVDVIVPFTGPKNDNLSTRQLSYSDVHGWYRARIGQPSAHLWNWGLIWKIWGGGPNALHQSVRILFTLCPILHPEVGPLPSLFTVGTCFPSCLEEHRSNR